LPGVDQLEVGLVDERGGLEGVPDPLVTHMAPCDPAQLCVDHRYEAVDRPVIPLAPSEEERRDFGV
jgi:hypothetical protein